MSTHVRSIVGLSIGSGLEGVDAALVRVEGHGLSMMPRVVKSQRILFAPELRDALQMRSPPPPYRAAGDALGTAVRKITTVAGVDSRDIFCIGLHTPNGGAFGTAAETIADQTGCTVITSFAARDLAAGGMGSPLTPAADFLLARDEFEDRVLIHVGAAASIVFLPANGKLSEIVAFDAGPGNRCLDAIVHRCTREKDHRDNGIRAVQGRAHDDLLALWSRHPYLQRKPPKAFTTTEYEEAFVTSAIDEARQRGIELNDLLCTASHFIARCIGHSVQHWLPQSEKPQSLFLSGGGTRNGLLRQLLGQQFLGEPLKLSDDLGVPALARKASAAAVLAGLTLDGVTGNLPLVTGATGGRLIGRIIPGDPRNWAKVAAWAAEQMWDYVQFSKAA